VAEFRTMQSSEEPAADTVPTLEPEEHDPIEYTGDATAAAQDDPLFPGPATRQVVGIVLTFTLIPMLIYLASYTPWFLSTKRYVPPRCNNTVTDAGGLQRTKPKAGFSLWLCYQNEIKDYHKNLKATKEDGTPIHPYLSHAWSWPWIGRPAAHYFHAETRQVNVRTCSNITGTSVCTNNVKPVTYDSEVLGAPNPVVWWPAFFIAIPLLLWWAIRRDAIAALILAMFAPLYVPWLITTRPLFMFYMTPAAPFLVLALTHVLHRTVKRWPSSIAVVSAFPAMAVLGFVYFYPVLAAYPVTEPVWRSRMLFGGGSKLSFAGDCTSRFMKIRCWI
jgi:dolichyl-phosphate-mannose-protein mannosyltransferase